MPADTSKFNRFESDPKFKNWLFFRREVIKLDDGPRGRRELYEWHAYCKHCCGFEGKVTKRRASTFVPNRPVTPAQSTGVFRRRAFVEHSEHPGHKEISGILSSMKINDSFRKIAEKINVQRRHFQRAALKQAFCDNPLSND